MSPMVTTRDKEVDDIVESNRRRIRQDKENRERQKQVIRNWQELKKKGFGFAPEGRVPVILDYDKGRFLYDVMQNNEWKNQRCFIIGGGESFKDFDCSRLKGELVIGVNRAFEKMDCTVNFAMDRRFYNWIYNDKLGVETRKRFDEYRGYKVWMNSGGYNYPQGIYVINRTGDHNLSMDLKRGLTGESNSGYAALNLAVCLGANPIYLLGFDMKGGENEKQKWWHDGYPQNQGTGVYKGFKRDFEKIAPKLKEKKIRVINLNPESGLKCFEFGEFKDIPEIKRPVITSFYTKGNGYEKQAQFLIDTIRRFNFDYDIQGIEDRGSWRKNVYYKPIFIKKMLNKYPNRSIVFVDADAKIRKNPVLFNNYDCDLAFHLRGGKELLSGTLYFGNTKGSHFIVDKWIEQDEKYTNTHMPQRNLAAVFNKNKDKIKWKTLPVEYCMIFDSRSRHSRNPVIEHFQFSRKYKERKPKRYEYRMIQDLTEIREYCRDKRICLIGNADSVLRRERKIDSQHDIICRMNRGTPKGKERFIGERTDILFLSTGMSGENIKTNFDPKYVVWCTECIRLAQSWVLHNAIQNPAKDWHWLHKRLGKNPSTGMMALYFMLQNIQFRKLTIYGFDFFATKSWYNTEIDSGQKHNGQKEKVLFGELVKDKKNIRLVKT